MRALAVFPSLVKVSSPALLKRRVTVVSTWKGWSAALSAGLIASSARTPLGAIPNVAPRGRTSLRSSTATRVPGLHAWAGGDG